MSIKPLEDDPLVTNPYTKREAHRRKTAIPVPSSGEVFSGAGRAVKITGDIISFVRGKISKKAGITLAIIATAVAGLGVAWQFKGKEIYENHKQEEQEKPLPDNGEIWFHALLQIKNDQIVITPLIIDRSIIIEQTIPLSSLTHSSLNRVSISPTINFTDHDGKNLKYISEEILVSEEDLQKGTVLEITAHLNQ